MNQNHVIANYEGTSFINNGDIVKFGVNDSPTTATSLNNHDQITGFYTTSTGEIRGFLRDPSGDILTFDGGDELQDLRPQGINDAGLISGTAFNGTEVVGFVGTPGNFTSLTFPDAIAIVATGINNRNEITGAYVDQFPHLAHLFVVTANPAESAVPEPGTFILAAGGLLSATSKLRRSSRTAKLQ